MGAAIKTVLTLLEATIVLVPLAIYLIQMGTLVEVYTCMHGLFYIHMQHTCRR